MNFLTTLWDDLKSTEAQALGPQIINAVTNIVKNPTALNFILQVQEFQVAAVASQPNIAQTLLAGTGAAIITAVQGEMAKQATAAK